MRTRFSNKMGTLGGFPNPPALWLRRAKPGFAYATMGTLGGLAVHSAPATHPASPALRAASPNPPALWLQAGRPWAKPACANAAMGTLEGLAAPRCCGAHATMPELPRAFVPPLAAFGRLASC